MSIQATGVRVASSNSSCSRHRNDMGDVLDGAGIMKNKNVVRLLSEK